MTARAASAPPGRNMDRGHAALRAFRRQELERWIEHAIGLLDKLDGDPDLELEVEEWNGDEGKEDWRRQPRGF